MDKILKNKKLRHNEYYGTQKRFDQLYEQSKDGRSFKNLMQDVQSTDNIMLAYRNIKRNKGSMTKACDEQTIKDIEQMPQKEFIEKVQKRMHNYNPGLVRRKDIPKPNGKTRPLGIPSIWDRIIQQCILQVLEPICEAKFSERSYGFRPNRSAENAIAEASRRINQQQLTYVVDVDIKGFFDEVNHVKLMRQLWTLGIKDKQLLVIIRRILKAPILMPDGKVVHPTKGTPQGGILSPLLANINLNEFDWWIQNQYELFDIKEVKPCMDKQNNVQSRSNIHKKLKQTKLKPMFIVRYADDFKIFTDTRSNAEKIFEAVEMWLKERLKLPISTEKSKVTNLKKHASEFLGFTLKAVKKNPKVKRPKGMTLKQYKVKKTKAAQSWKKNHGNTPRVVAETHMSQKAIKHTKEQLVSQIKKIQKSPNSNKTMKEVGKYNSMVIGIHNYYRIATHNYDWFLNLSDSALIFNSQIYQRCNLNNVTVKHLNEMPISKGKLYKPNLNAFDILSETQYTFEELSLLANCGHSYF